MALHAIGIHKLSNQPTDHSNSRNLRWILIITSPYSISCTNFRFMSCFFGILVSSNSSHVNHKLQWIDTDKTEFCISLPTFLRNVSPSASVLHFNPNAVWKLNHKYRGDMFSSSVGNHLQDYTSSQPGRLSWTSLTITISLMTNAWNCVYRIGNTRFRFHIGFRKIVSAKVSYRQRRTHASQGSPLLPAPGSRCVAVNQGARSQCRPSRGAWWSLGYGCEVFPNNTQLPASDRGKAASFRSLKTVKSGFYRWNRFDSCKA